VPPSLNTAVALPAPQARPAAAPPDAYERLIGVVLALNAGVLGFHLERGDWRAGDGSALSAFAALLLVNFAVAVLIRQQHVLNALFALAGRTPRRAPLWLRWSVSKVHHVGGIHAGAALAGTAWLVAFAVAAAPADATTRALAYTLVALAPAIVVAAAPPVRRRAHNVFELTHRFGGWSAIALFWALTLHLSSGPGDWRIWVLALTTASLVSPWLRLRRVPITVERPSSHAAVVRFDHGVTPAFASAVGISRSPLREWHAFATVTTPGESGYRLLISRAGDWTGRFIDDPPTHVWVRGVPVTAPMAKAALLYERVVYVVTGSGIGPALGQVLAARVPARLVWSTRAPRATYGDALVDEVEAAQPGAVVWDTTERGKPDLLALTRQAVREFGAEAVFVVANQSATRRLVAGLEADGIPAFGPIWDS
jgi:hypothetical protein